MELLNIECLGKRLRLEGSMAGWQQLYWDNQLVSQKSASADNQSFTIHEFELSRPSSLAEPSHDDVITQTNRQVMKVRLESDVQWQPFIINYTVLVDNNTIADGQRNSKDIERQTPEVAPVKQQKFSFVGLASLGFKLLKSAKVIKAMLAAASVAAYSWLFSIEFALALIACLVIHEYGHIKAMKHFGMKTKGIYLIPFMGGLAVSDERINTRWQNVVISIMGPTFGLFMSIGCMLAYWLTGNIFFAGLASFNALLNLFNLLPILPLDGGHILKSITFSMNSMVGLIACIAGAAAGVFISYSLGLALLGFLLLIGSLEIVFEWKSRHQSHLLPLDRYGQIFSTLWYFITVGLLIAIIWYFAASGDEMLSMPLEILRS
ncbi:MULTISPECIES: site-2 protease family protein [unclassified Shewanella]|uniref:site-2 protease family protein n=1 Tax=unclassified Shewanella TaxID=196818 RepID=UPI000C862A36|nr:MULTISPECIES: site-2 protease family protein [unclassified Shewanella]MDO6638607.1 site-2 protease family protein [Shewanella sp. 5_MG-2023]MDO6679875.1 site-2 protease family protein [Shewanella sp. 4_MG-2023]MDO6774573.1 site-2 protease family protein [Shewanella sp. 3_MG-2023]PMG32234.1 Zn-dependent protease [Shewanella sp. 10N.286.52.C2]PMH88318.1 Zn-dependent protease [Shewanella sp. 10N.286.48.B5]